MDHVMNWREEREGNNGVNAVLIDKMNQEEQRCVGQSNAQH